MSIHAQSALLANGWPPHSAARAGQLFYRDALEHIGGITELRILTVGLPTNRPLDVYHLWFWMAYALLVERRAAPSPERAVTTAPPGFGGAESSG